MAAPLKLATCCRRPAPRGPGAVREGESAHAALHPHHGPHLAAQCYPDVPPECSLIWPTRPALRTAGNQAASSSSKRAHVALHPHHTSHLAAQCYPDVPPECSLMWLMRAALQAAGTQLALVRGCNSAHTASRPHDESHLAAQCHPVVAPECGLIWHTWVRQQVASRGHIASGESEGAHATLSLPHHEPRLAAQRCLDSLPEHRRI